MSRSRVEGFDWLVDRAAAAREQFPTVQKLMNERPGCKADRDRQAMHREDNRRSVERASAAARRARRQEQDADLFIEQMQRRRQLEFAAKVAAKQGSRTA